MGLFNNSDSDKEQKPPSNGAKRRGSIFSRKRIGNDPMINVAREKVTLAEKAEKEADKALLSARNAVKAARDHVKKLEKEASEEARRAKAKQDESKSMLKSVRGLGRHD